MDTTDSGDTGDTWFDHTWFAKHGNGVTNDTWQRYLWAALPNATPEKLFEEANTFIWASHKGNYGMPRF